MRLSLLLMVLGCLMTTALPSRAHSHCDAVDGMLSVDEDDRNFVRTLCEMSSDDATLWQQAHSDQPEGKRLARLAQRTTETSRSDATILASVLPEGALPRAKSVITCSPEAYQEAFDAALIRVRSDRSDDRRVGTLALHQACADVSPAPAKGEEGLPSTSSAARPWTILAPPGSDVRLLVGGQIGGLWLVEAADTRCKAGNNGCKDGTLEPKRAGLVPYTALVPLGVPYVAVVVQKRKLGTEGAQAILTGTEEAAPLPLVLQGILSDEYTAIGVPQAASCVDVRVAAEEDLRFFLDGQELELDHRNGTFERTVWVPRDAREETTSHRLLVVGRGKSGQQQTILAEQEIFAKPQKKSCAQHDRRNGQCDEATTEDRDSTCVEAHFDLTRSVFNDTIGLLDIDVGRCADAGIDEHKVRAAAEAFLERAGWKLADVKGWADDSEAVASLGESSARLRGSAGRPHEFRDGYGAARGRLDIVEVLASGGEELRRQGFARVLDLGLRCSRSAENWDYSFEARVIDVKALVEAPRDPLRGVPMDGIVRDEIELILDRRELLVGIETTLGRALRTESLGLRVLPARADFVEQLAGDVIAQVPVEATGYHYVQLTYAPISEAEAVTTCAKVAQIHELRAKSVRSPLLPHAKWVSGPFTAVNPSATEQTIHIGVQQTRPSQFLVRAQLVRSSTPVPQGRSRAAATELTPLAESYRCTDLRRPPVETWVTVGGWFSMAGDPARNESSRSIVGAVGFDWLNDIPWVSLGLGLAYAYTYREGGLLPVWDGVDNVDPDLFDPTGLTEYSVREHAVFGVINFRSLGSLCEATAGNVCGRVARRVLFEANAQILPGVHIIDTTGIPPEFATFRGAATQYELADVGAFVGLGIGADAGPLRVFFRYAIGMRRIGDLVRSPVAPGTSPALLSAPSLGAAWEF